MVRELSENDMYAVLRFALIAQFADEKFMDRYDLSISDYQGIYDFLKKLYFEHCRNREDIQK